MVIDGFGTAHAIAAKSTIGRSQDGELVVLASSVSREHAELRRRRARQLELDLGELAGGAR